MKKNIAVIYGGRSGEHEISIRSARTVIEQADATKYNVIPVAISPEGAWLSPAKSLELFPDDVRENYSDKYGEAARDRFAMLGDAGLGGLVQICETCGKACATHTAAV